MQLELALPLGGQRDQARVVRARRDFAEPHLLALDEQFHAEQAQAAQVVGHGLGNLLRLRLGRGGHGMGLPAFHVVARLLDMADRVAEMGLDLAVRTLGAHGQLGDFVVEIDETFDDHTALGHAATGHGVVPGLLHIGGAVDLALALAGAAHHRLDHAGVADGGLAVGAVNGSLQLFGGIAKAVGAGGQAQGFGRQAADAFAVHGQARGARRGDDGDHARGFQLFQHGGGNGFDLGHNQIGLLGFDQGLELRRIAHGDGARMVGHLLAGGMVIAVDRNGLHAQALQGDQHFLAQLAAAQQHDFGGVGGEGGSEGGHSKRQIQKRWASRTPRTGLWPPGMRTLRSIIKFCAPCPPHAACFDHGGPPQGRAAVRYPAVSPA